MLCSNSKDASENRSIPKARPLPIYLQKREPPPKNPTEPQPLLMLSHKFQKRTSKQNTGTSASNGTDTRNSSLIWTRCKFRVWAGHSGTGACGFSSEQGYVSSAGTSGPAPWSGAFSGKNLKFTIAKLVLIKGGEQEGRHEDNTPTHPSARACKLEWSRLF